MPSLPFKALAAHPAHNLRHTLLAMRPLRSPFFNQKKTMIGPHIHIQLETQSLVCTRCVYLKHNLIRSGRDPQWECLCLHPKAKETAESTPGVGRVWSTNGADGCWIGEDPETPSWCPVRKDHKPEGMIRCPFCDKEFDLDACEMDSPTLPNTLTNLPDHNTPLAVCPHCGCRNQV